MTWPYVDIWIDLWLVQVGTSLWYETLCCLRKDYIRLKVTICHRWGFSFRLYSPNRR